MPSFRTSSIAACAALIAFTSIPPADAETIYTGSKLKALMPGAILNTDDGSDCDYRKISLNPDGTLAADKECRDSGFTGEKFWSTKGKWAIKEDSVCLNYDDWADDNDCWTFRNKHVGFSMQASKSGSVWDVSLQHPKYPDQDAIKAALK